MAQTYFATIAPGLEDVLLQELRTIGAKRPRVLHGGVEFDAARKTLYAAALRLRTANRLWLRVDEFRARDAPELYNKTRRYDWSRLIKPNAHLAIRARSGHSNLYHTDKIREAVEDALRDHFSEDQGLEAPTFSDPSDGALTILARLEDNRCQLSLDAAGDRLHKRGWRTHHGGAPLRESLASALLSLSGWTPDIPLLDPLCGSGTIPIEAALQSIQRAPGLDRSFALQQWQNHLPDRFQSIVHDLRQATTDSLQAPIMGADRDASVLSMADQHEAQASIDGLIEWTCRELTAWADDPPFDDDQPFMVVTNPPYGHRLSLEDQLLDQLLAFTDVGRTTLCFVWPSDRRDQIHQRRPGAQRLAQFKNGGIAIDAWRL